MNTEARRRIGPKAAKALALGFAVSTFGFWGMAVSQEPASQPALSVRWLPPCSVRDASPFFAIDVFDDGTARYVGGAQAREVGERTVTLGEGRARRLVRLAVQAEGGSAELLQRKDPDERTLYCLEITMRTETSTMRYNSEERRVQPLIRAFDRIVEERRWVCPERLRSGGERGNLFLTGFCGGYAAREALRIAIEKNGCVTLNAKVYKGLIYFKVNRKRGGGDYAAVREGYAAIDRREFDELIREARTSDLSNESLIEEPHPRVDRDYQGNASADLARLYDLAFRVLGLRNDPSLAASGASCDQQKDFSGYLSLRYEFGPPTKRIQ